MVMSSRRSRAYCAKCKKAAEPRREGGWEYLRVVFFDNTLGRFVNLPNFERFNPGPLNDAFTGSETQQSFPLFAHLLVDSSAVVTDLSGFVDLAVSAGAADDFRIFLKLAIVIVPVLTLSASKSLDYLVPLLFIMLLIAGEFVRDLFSNSPKATRLENLLCRITSSSCSRSLCLLRQAWRCTTSDRSFSA
jgi:hypothetical protein